jgi:hypothetical protein
MQIEIDRRGRGVMEQGLEQEIRKGLESGPGREWRDEDWEALLRGEYKHTPEEESWAAPPGWRSPRLKKDA